MTAGSKEATSRYQLIPLEGAEHPLPLPIIHESNPGHETQWEEMAKVQAFARAWSNLWRIAIGPAALSGDAEHARQRADAVRDELFVFVGTLSGDGEAVIEAIDDLIRLLPRLVRSGDRRTQRKLLRANRRVLRKLGSLQRQIAIPSWLRRTFLGGDGSRLDVPHERKRQIEAAVRSATLGLSNKMGEKIGLPQQVRDALNFFGIPFWDANEAEALAQDAKRRYRQYAVENHPDVATADRESAERRMQEANSHWAVLQMWIRKAS